MNIVDNAYSHIELVDGVFYQKLNNGIKNQIFLYKYKRKEAYLSQEDIFDTKFNYDFVVFDKDNETYLYFTYAYVDDPEEIF